MAYQNFMVLSFVYMYVMPDPPKYNINHILIGFHLLLSGVQMMRKFHREKELRKTVFPEGMEEFRQLLDCEGKQKATLLESVSIFSCSATWSNLKLATQLMFV